MEIKDFVSRQSARDEALKEIAAKIRPLPEDVVPSAGFREQTRLQLLKLDLPEYKHRHSRQAA